ncbi:MAG: response regulator with CheY-like receiver domain and winged-helix DNA-binding domain [Cyanobacteria bacterium RYN_339]|nr:response regulator with CheY-like receiver domain and winged-helix DNA-binding domain [Cyanobacteria bacterium RYN_339]
MTAPKARILLVEDEPEIAEFVATELRFEGFEVRVEHDGMRGMIAARQDLPDLLILDRNLPGLDGLEITRRLRKTSDVPIILLTARGEPRERVEGLNAGANDYLPKPFDLDELIARVNAQLRAHKPKAKTSFEVADLALDTETREVRRAGQQVALTPKEFDLLKYLIANARQVRTREQILEAVWGYDFGGEDNVLEVYVRYLRNKIERPELGKLLHTVRGVGYVLKDAE